MSDSKSIPFADGQMSGLDALSGAAQTLQNYLPDAAGGLRVRPGIRQLSDFPGAPASSAVIGLTHWRSWTIFILANRAVYAWEDSGAVLDLAYSLGGSGRPIFAYDQSRVVFTGGGAPGKWEGVGAASDLAPGAVAPDGSPLALRSIAYASQRLVGAVNNGSGILQWTGPGPGSHGTWPIVGPYYAEAEASPDPLARVIATTNELFAIGTETTQVYSPDPSDGFSVAASLQVGVASDTLGYADIGVIETEDGQISWLDNNRRWVTSSGRSVEVLSSPGMAATAKSLSTVSDSWGVNVMLEGWDLLVWCYPTEGRTFAFDKVTKKWCEWSSLDTNGDSQSWIAQSYCYWAERNLHLVGLDDGTLAELTFEASDDDGLPIKAVSETGFQDRGTFKNKICEFVYVQFRRGSTVPPAIAPVATLRYRDDLGNWKTATEISMGAAQYQPVVQAECLGEYRQRQWRLEWTGGNSFMLAGATEQFVTEDV